MISVLTPMDNCLSCFDDRYASLPQPLFAAAEYLSQAQLDPEQGGDLRRVLGPYECRSRIDSGDRHR